MPKRQILATIVLIFSLTSLAQAITPTSRSRGDGGAVQISFDVGGLLPQFETNDGMTAFLHGDARITYFPSRMGGIGAWGGISISGAGSDRSIVLVTTSSMTATGKTDIPRILVGFNIGPAWNIGPAVGGPVSARFAVGCGPYIIHVRRMFQIAGFEETEKLSLDDRTTGTFGVNSMLSLTFSGRQFGLGASVSYNYIARGKIYLDGPQKEWKRDLSFVGVSVQAVWAMEIGRVM